MKYFGAAQAATYEGHARSQNSTGLHNMLPKSASEGTPAQGTKFDYPAPKVLSRDCFHALARVMYLCSKL